MRTEELNFQRLAIASSGHEACVKNMQVFRSDTQLLINKILLVNSRIFISCAKNYDVQVLECS